LEPRIETMPEKKFVGKCIRMSFSDNRTRELWQRFMPFFNTKDPQVKERKPTNIIFDTWLPDSDSLLDNKPHFEIMGDQYKNEDPDSEEELWIPIKKR
jgi:AraC family transcriptional regulator